MSADTEYDIAALKILVTTMLAKEFAPHPLQAFDDFSDDLNGQLINFPVATERQRNHREGIRAALVTLLEDIRTKLP